MLAHLWLERSNCSAWERFRSGRIATNVVAGIVLSATALWRPKLEINCTAMSQRKLNVRTSGPITGRSEVIVAIDGLAKRVAHLARKIEHIRPTALTKQNSPLKIDGQLELAFSEAIAEPACKPGAVAIVEAANFPLSPEQNGGGATVNESGNKTKVARPEPKTNGRRAENGVANHVLILHDRLGGFMKPPIPVTLADDENT
jgi:hypothetical protein